MTDTKQRLCDFLKRMPLDPEELRLALRGIEVMDDEEARAILEDLEGAVMSLQEALEALRPQD